MAKKETIPTIIDTPEALTAKMAAMKEAQKIFATYTQEQVDKIFKVTLHIIGSFFEIQIIRIAAISYG